MIKLGDMVKSKLRLWLEYALIGIVVILAGIVLAGYVSRLKLNAQVAGLETKVTAAEGKLEVVEEVNKQQAKAIETINSLTKVSDSMLQGLATDMEALRVRDRTTYDRLASLEKSNEAVRKYLNSAVPDAVGCLLDQTCAPDDHSVPGAKRGPASPVPAPKPPPVKNKQ